MKKSDLLNSMNRIMPRSADAFIEGNTAIVNLPMAVSFVAAHAFVHEKDDDADAGNIKEYLLGLERNGHYEFDSEK